jgi:arylsulfatase
LSELRLEEQTLVMFTSDNGPWLIRGEDGGSATPLRAGKGTTYEGGMRVPCIMRWMGRIPETTVCSEVATTMDILPTFAKLAGGDPPNDRIIDGRDIYPLMSGQPGAASPHEAFYYYAANELHAVRSGPWKLKLETSLRDEDIYVHPGDPEAKVSEALYNLRTDPGEQKSVLKDHPDVAERLRSLAQRAREDLGDARTGVTGKNVRPIGAA